MEGSLSIGDALFRASSHDDVERVASASALSSTAVDLFALESGQYVERTAGTDGWLVSAATGIELLPAGAGKLRIRLERDDASTAELPEE